MESGFVIERRKKTSGPKQKPSEPLNKGMLAMSEKKDVPFLRRMDIARNFVEKERDEINKQVLHEYTRLTELKLIKSAVSTVMIDFKDHMGELNEGMNLLRKAFTSITKLLETKFEKEKIDWTKFEITTREDAEWVVRISEAKMALSEAYKRFSEFEELAAEMEAATAEAAKEASDFIEEAEASDRNLKQMEELERKRKEEEEARKQQEEKDRKQREKEEAERKKKEEEEKKKEKEEEEKRQREEKERIKIEREEREKREKEEAENRRIEEEAKRKIEEEEKERQRKEEEIIKKKKSQELRQREQEERNRRQEEARKRREREEEERRLEAERRDPKNWENWLYSVDVEEGEIPLGCVIKAMANTANREDFSVKCVSQLSGTLNLNQNESLVSHIINITHVDDDFAASIPLSILIPHQAPRNPARDTVIKMKLESGWWREIPTNDIILDDVKEYKFVECRAERVSSFAVVTRPKIETYTVPREGAKLTSCVDGRVSFDIKSHFFKFPSQVELEVQPVDSSTISDLHNRYPECSGLVTASPIVKFTTPLKQSYTKNVSVNIPLPSPNIKKERPRPKSAWEGPTKQMETRQRPMTAFRPDKNQTDEEGEHMMILVQRKSGCWTTLDGVSLKKNKHKDIVMFELDRPIDRFVIVKSKDDILPSRAEKNVSTLEETIYDRHVQLVLRQRSSDPSDIVVWATPLLKTDDVISRLHAKGFESGPQPSEDIIMREGDEIYVRFKGNIKHEENLDEMKMVFNSSINTKLNFRVVVEDPFYQKAKPKFYGFVKALTFEKVPEKSQDEDGRDATQIKMVTKLLPAADFLVELPKPDPGEPMPIVSRAPLKVKPEGLVDEDMLHHIASELGDEWKKMAPFLGVKSSRLQAIERNNVNSATDSIVFEMLMTWIKSVPKSTNKVRMLVHALVGCGREDLASLMRDKEREFKREASISARDNHIRKGIICINKSQSLVNEWKLLAEALNIRYDTIEEIERNSDNTREQCNQMLLTWQDGDGNTKATPSQLVAALRKCGHSAVADHIADIMKEMH